MISLIYLCSKSVNKKVIWYELQISEVITAEKRKFSNLIKKSTKKIKPFETIGREIMVTVIAIIITDSIIQTLVLPSLPFSNMLLEIYVHVSTILSAFGILYVYRVSRHLRLITMADTFQKDASLPLKPRINILIDLIKEADNFLETYLKRHNDPKAIQPEVKANVITCWLSGNARDKIAANNSIDTGEVNKIINDWKKENLNRGKLFLIDLIKDVDKFLRSGPLDPTTGSSILNNELKEFEEQIANITKEKGGILTSRNANEVFKSLFTNGSQYFATDPNVPSQFKRWQEDLNLLDNQKKFQIMHEYREGKRVLILEEDDIKYDYILNRDKFDEFMKDHGEMKVELRTVTPSIAASSYKPGLKSQDVGIWIDAYCIHYDRLISDSDEKARVMITLYKKNGENNNYNICLDYFNELYDQAEPLDKFVERIDQTLYQKVIELSTPDLAQEWDKYVDTWNEDVPPEGHFLDRVIKDLKKSKSNLSILDAAAATGRWTIFLTKQGYKIDTNSIDRNLDNRLHQNLSSWLSTAEPHKIKNYTRHDLRLFDQFFRPRKFDIIILIGNVLSRLLNKYERERTIDQCFKILKPGGTLIIDNRNFDKILSNKSNPEILTYDGFYEKFYKAKYIYCGKSVRGWPKCINDDRIEFTFGYRTKSFGCVTMYPLKNDELQDLLVARSFRVDIYKDYDYANKIRLDQKIDNKDKSLDADFIVYVAHKPPND
jgi:glycine/sarcosine N-methyltransferase